MSDYVPVFYPGDSITLTASAAITGGQLCVVSGANTVAPSSAATHNFVGVAAFDVASGSDLTLHCEGVQRLVAGGTIAAGDRVMAATAGTVVTFTGTDYSQVVGIALTAAVATATVDVNFR